LADQGVTVEAFFEALKQVQKDGENNESSFYVQLLISITEYENFIGMMQNYCESH
jgi:hypothetical protein